MIETYWGLSGSPFQAADRKPWFHESPVHEEALARLYFVIEERRPCGLLRGMSGTGKTQTLHRLAGELRRSGRSVVPIDLLGLTAEELLWRTAAGLRLGLSDTATPLQLWRAIGDCLEGFQSSRQSVVMLFDHLERADADCGRVIERLLAMDGGSRRSLTVIAAARIADRGASAALAPYADLRIELAPLDRDQTAAYVDAALRQAGAGHELFDPAALDSLYRQTRGIPREINRLCELALIAAMGQERPQVDADVIESAAAELQAC